jgi:hypothetical protein
MAAALSRTGRYRKCLDLGKISWVFVPDIYAQPLSEDLIYTLVKQSGAAIGHRDLAPDNLRRMCAKLCRKAGGD